MDEKIDNEAAAKILDESMGTSKRVDIWNDPWDGALNLRDVPLASSPNARARNALGRLIDGHPVMGCKGCDAVWWSDAAEAPPDMETSPCHAVDCPVVATIQALQDAQRHGPFVCTAHDRWPCDACVVAFVDSTHKIYMLGNGGNEHLTSDPGTLKLIIWVLRGQYRIALDRIAEESRYTERAHKALGRMERAKNAEAKRADANAEMHTTAVKRSTATIEELLADIALLKEIAATPKDES